MNANGDRKRCLPRQTGWRRTLAMIGSVVLFLVFIPWAVADRETDFRLSYRISPEGWANGDVTIHLTAPGGSGMRTGIYALGSSAPLPGGNNTSFIAGENGVYSFEAMGADTAQSQVLEVPVANIDRTPPETPVITVMGEGGEYTGCCTVAAEVSQDGGSPIKLFYELDGGDETPYKAPLTISLPGTHRITVAARDAAGNASGAARQFTVAGVAFAAAGISDPPGFIGFGAVYPTTEDIPVALSTTVKLSENGSVDIDLGNYISSPDIPYMNKALTIDLSSPSNGALEKLGGFQVRYSPDPHFYGEDQFDYMVSDGSNSVSATVTLRVQAIADPHLAVYRGDQTDWQSVPVGEDEQPVWELHENEPADFPFRIWAPTGSEPMVTYAPMELNRADDHASMLPYGRIAMQLNGEYGTLTLDPLPDTFGEMLIRFNVDQSSEGLGITRYVRVRVIPSNTAPVLEDIHASTPKHVEVSGALEAYDRETQGGLVLRLHTDETDAPVQPANGTAAVEKGEDGVWWWSYTPKPHFFGEDSFQVDAVDPDGLTATATVWITVTPVNEPPDPPTDLQLDKDWYADGEGIILTYTAGEDMPGETARENLTYDIELSVNNGETWNRLANGYSAPLGDGFSTTCAFACPPVLSIDGLRVRVRTVDDDPIPLVSGWAESATIMLNTAPRAVAQTVFTYLGAGVDIELGFEDSDPGDAASRFSIVDGVQKGTLSPLDLPGRYHYMPGSLGQADTDSFTYTVADLRGLVSEEATVAIYLLLPPLRIPNGSGGGSTKSLPDTGRTIPDLPSPLAPAHTSPSPESSGGGNPGIGSGGIGGGAPAAAAVSPQTDEVSSGTTSKPNRNIRVSSVRPVGQQGAGQAVAASGSAGFGSAGLLAGIAKAVRSADPIAVAAACAAAAVASLLLFRGFGMQVEYVGGSGAKRRRCFFGRLHHGGAMELDITDAGLENFTDAEFRVRLGPLYRRRFYGRPMTIYFAGRSASVKVPAKAAYKAQCGIHISGRELHRILPD